MSWNSYNAFVDGLGKGHNLAPTFTVWAVLVIFVLVMRQRSRKRSP